MKFPNSPIEKLTIGSVFAYSMLLDNPKFAGNIGFPESRNQHFER